MHAVDTNEHDAKFRKVEKYGFKCFKVIDVQMWIIHRDALSRKSVKLLPKTFSKLPLASSLQRKSMQQRYHA